MFFGSAQWRGRRVEIEATRASAPRLAPRPYRITRWAGRGGAARCVSRRRQACHPTHANDAHSVSLSPWKIEMNSRHRTTQHPAKSTEGILNPARFPPFSAVRIIDDPGHEAGGWDRK